MSDVALLEPAVEAPFIRRFQSSDLSKHGPWLYPRLLKLFPHMNEGRVYGWLLDMMGQNDFLFLYSDHGIAACMLRSEPMKQDAVVEEIFVWVADKTDERQVREGAHFYTHFYEWAKRKSVPTVVIEANTDISRKAILDVTGRRVFETKLSYIRVRDE